MDLIGSLNETMNRIPTGSSITIRHVGGAISTYYTVTANVNGKCSVRILDDYVLRTVGPAYAIEQINEMISTMTV